MSVSVDERYRQLCRKHGDRAFTELEIELKAKPSMIDVGEIYFPRRHLKCIVDLIKERSEITVVKFDNCTLTSEDLTLLFESLRETRVASLSLKNVKMNIRDGEQLKELCKLNCHITEINLDGSLLPEELISRICLAAELNNALLSERNIQGRFAVSPENLQVGRIDLWASSMLEDKLPQGKKLSKQSLNEIMNHIISSECDYFTDDAFNFEEEWFRERCPEIEWRRGLCTVTDADIFFRGCLPVLPSTILENRNLCTVLNLIQMGYLKANITGPLMSDIRCFVFHFFISDSVREVIIDDYLPFIKREDGTLEPATAHSSGDDFFGALVEKAVAKLFGGYSKIESISLPDYISLFTKGICIRKVWHEKLTSSQLYEFTRHLFFEKTKIVGFATPKNSNARAALIRKGFVPNAPYALISTDMVRSKEGHVEQLVQLAGPPTDQPIIGAYTTLDYPITSLCGFHVFWMRYQDFMIDLEDLFSFRWIHGVDNEKLRKTVNVIDDFSQWTLAPASFASNPSFYLQSTADADTYVLISFECEESYSDVWKQFHIYSLPSSATDDDRRYAISKKNRINFSERVTGRRGGILQRMSHGECLQIVVSVGSPIKCVVQASSLKPFNFSVMRNKLSSKLCEGTWNYFHDGKRASDRFYVIKNVSPNVQKNYIICVSQRQTKQNPYGISLLIWPNMTPRDVPRSLNAVVETEIECEAVAVFQIPVNINPGGTTVLLPCRHDERCPAQFCFNVYSEGEISVSMESNPVPLFE